MKSSRYGVMQRLFQVSFNKYEELLLHDRKYANKTIICLKFFIRQCEPYLKNLSSHAIKSVVMNIIVEDPSYFNKKGKGQLEEGFLHCFQRLEDMVTGLCIPDIIFKDKVNVFRFVFHFKRRYFQF